MKCIRILFSLIAYGLLWGASLCAQSSFVQIYDTLPLVETEGTYTSAIKEIPIVHPFPFFSFVPVADISHYNPAIFSLEVRFASPESLFTAWKEVDLSHDMEEIQKREEAAPAFFGQMQIIDTLYSLYQYRLSSALPVKWLRFDFFSPGKVGDPLPQRPPSDSICICPLPAFVNRTGWNCPDGQAPSCVAPFYYPVTHLIVHHSAGSSTSNDWPAIVLAIWNLHVNTNGWCDIGYNWLIDRDGVIYEGRGGGNNVRGAHFCGNNTATMGVCVLGNFQTTDPSEQAVESLSRLMAWKACDSGLDPLDTTFHTSSGKDLPVISGHRDGCATDCPGRFLYPQLPEIRSQVDSLLESCQVGTSLDRESRSLAFSLYPNPSPGIFSLEFSATAPGQGLWELYNLNGQLVARQEKEIVAGMNQWQIKLGKGIAPGIYGLRWQGPGIGGWKQVWLR